MMIFCIALCFGVSIFYGAQFTMEWWQRQQRASRIRGQRQVSTRSLLMRRALKPAQQCAGYVEGYMPTALRRWVQRQCAVVTMPQVDAASLVLCSFGLGGIVHVLVGALSSWPSIQYSLATLATVMPWLWIVSERKNKQQQITRLFPRMIEMLSLSLGAGLELERALQCISESMADSPMRSALVALLRDLRFGMTRMQAWERFAQRINLPQVDTTVATIIQALHFGTPLAEVLGNAARHMQGERIAQVERAAAVAAQKILAPLILCFVPEYFLLLIGGVGLNFFVGGGMSWIAF